MKVTILGGVGEYGRACFLIETLEKKILLDCGVMKGESILKEARYPLIDAQLARAIDYIFITHSHEDHWGAIEELDRLGFEGEIYCTEQTKKQIQKIANTKGIRIKQELIELEKVGKNFEFNITEEMVITWGPSGHGRGAVWYCIKLEGRTLFYSGDYSVESLLWKNTLPIEEKIDLTILDNGYGEKDESQKSLLAKLTNSISECIRDKGCVVLPTPKIGRGQELLLYIAKTFKETPIYVEETIYDELMEALIQDNESECKTSKLYLGLIKQHRNINRIDSITEWIKVSDKACIAIVAGGMLESVEVQSFYKKLGKKDKVILTGHQAVGTFGWKILNKKVDNCNSPICEYIRYNVHLGITQAYEVLQKIQSRNVILYHGSTDYLKNNKEVFSNKHYGNLLNLRTGESIEV